MSIRILCLHGVNTNENGNWFTTWQNTIRHAANRVGVPADSFEFHELRYNARFEQITPSPEIYAAAVKRLWNSYWAHRRALGRPMEKGLGTLIDNTIGMVAKWTALSELRQQLASDLGQAINGVNPHLICAHSLGSLIAYDTLAANPALVQDRLFVTLGSQIGHPALAETFGGYLKPLNTARHWYHLFNNEDAVLTCELEFPGAPFTQLDTFFDELGPLDHSAEKYLGHDVTASNVWAGLQLSVPRTATAAAKPKPAPAVTGNWFKAPSVLRSNPRKRRALLIGINDYPEPENRLSGCVNDVFLMSAMLQERGYQPEEIRVVLDSRATTRGVQERLKWLLGDVRAGDERVLFYSGHGAQVAAYDADGEPDHKDETLVTYDFDWSGSTGISDDMLSQLYANLPYDARFSIILDCCHSGGIARAGGVAVRGINPPDDVRHRSMAWDVDKQMWFARKQLDLTARMGKAPAAEIRRYLGPDGATRKMGRAVGRWSETPAEFKAATKRLGHHGPYNPVILAACREDQYAYEYTHGSVPYGALTFMLVQQLRASGGRKTLEDIVKQCNQVLKTKLGYDQETQLYRPREHKQTRFPGSPAKKAT